MRGVNIPLLSGRQQIHERVLPLNRTERVLYDRQEQQKTDETDYYKLLRRGYNGMIYRVRHRIPDVGIFVPVGYVFASVMQERSWRH